MRKCRALSSLLAVALAAAACRGDTLRPVPPPRRITIAQWNLENLFDTDDDLRNEGDDEFTPGSWRYWNERKYAVKLDNLSRTIADMDADILCVEEVENRRVLDDLTRHLRCRYSSDFVHVIHREGSDHRGIDVAILSRIEPADVRWIRPHDGQRDVLIADFRVGDHGFTIFVNHWKSNWGPREKALRLRREQARAVRAEIDNLLEDTPDAAILVVGDFNEDFNGPTITNVLQALPAGHAASDPERRPLIALHAQLDPEKRGTFFYRRESRWNSFDFVCVSRAMTSPGPGWRVQPESYAVFRPDYLLGTDGTPLPFRRLKNRKTGQWEFVEGFSDHLPVRLTLERRDQ